MEKITIAKYFIYFMFIFIVGLIFYLFCTIEPYKNYDNYKNIKGKTIILIGDFILDKNEKVITQLKKLRTTNKLLLLTDKCFVSNNIGDKLKKYTKLYNKNNTYFFISVGTNDVVENHNNCSENSVNNSKKETNNKKSCLSVTDIYAKWETNINQLLNAYPNAHITFIVNGKVDIDKTKKHCNVLIKSNKDLKQEKEKLIEKNQLKANKILSEMNNIKKKHSKETFTNNIQPVTNIHPINSDLKDFNKNIFEFISNHNKNISKEQKKMNIIFINNSDKPEETNINKLFEFMQPKLDS